MKKTIVTHISPDLDAITSVWLLVRFGGDDFKNAEIILVPAGERYDKENNHTVHVDTGLGKFDHHQEERGKKETCAARLVYEWLVEEGRIKESWALERLLSIVNEIDHFKNCLWSESGNDRYEFFLEQVLLGVKMGDGVRDDLDLLKLGMVLLDGVLVSLKVKLAAEEDLEKGIVFESKWGKSMGVESANSGIDKLALKSGYNLLVRKDMTTGQVRIKATPKEEIDLKELYEKMREADQRASWYFHPSGRMILNGSASNPQMLPSKLELIEVIEIIKSM